MRVVLLGHNACTGDAIGRQVKALYSGTDKQAFRA